MGRLVNTAPWDFPGSACPPKAPAAGRAQAGATVHYPFVIRARVAAGGRIRTDKKPNGTGVFGKYGGKITGPRARAGRGQVAGSRSYGNHFWRSELAAIWKSKWQPEITPDRSSAQDSQKRAKKPKKHAARQFWRAATRLAR